MAAAFDALSERIAPGMSRRARFCARRLAQAFPSAPSTRAIWIACYVHGMTNVLPTDYMFIDPTGRQVAYGFAYGSLRIRFQGGIIQGREPQQEK
jgi:hypothetical protein